MMCMGSNNCECIWMQTCGCIVFNVNLCSSCMKVEKKMTKKSAHAIIRVWIPISYPGPVCNRFLPSGYEEDENSLSVNQNSDHWYHKRAGGQKCRSFGIIFAVNADGGGHRHYSAPNSLSHKRVGLCIHINPTRVNFNQIQMGDYCRRCEKG